MAFSALERSHLRWKIFPNAGWICGCVLVNYWQFCRSPTFLQSAPIGLNLKQNRYHPIIIDMYPYQPNQHGQQPPNNQPNNAPSSNSKPHPNSYPFIQQQYAPQGFSNPQAASFAQNRNVYASTIQTSTSSNSLNRPAGMGLGKLESMGRVIKEDPDPVIHRTQEAPSSFHNQFSNNIPMGNQRGKLASSVIFQKNFDEDINRFPGFNVSNNTGTSRLDAMFAKKQQEAQKEPPVTESAEERRKREINSIKQELELLNKRMENTVIKKNEGEAKPYFQLPSRKSVAQNNTNPVQNPTENNKPTFQLNNSNNTEVSSNDNGSKAFFQSYSKGNPVQSPTENNKPTFQLNSNNTEASTNDGVSKGFFQSFNKGSTDNTISKPPVSQQPQPDPKPVQISIANNPIKTDGGGMFKKKNPYANQQVAKTVEQGPKTLMLSPKGAVNNNFGFKAQPVIVKNQTKAAEIIEPVIVAKKGMKRTASSEKIQGPKVFKKSDFAIGKKMGKGQFGQVMLVQHKETGFLCGMKVMSKKQIREEKYVNQIARELSIQFYLNHRNVAPLYGYFQDEENVYLLIEYCTGGQLLQMLRKNHRMEEADTSPIIRQICEGLDYIHKEEIIHRDIKPENILFNFNTVKICDFGWAVHCGSGMRKTVSGSPLYYSPEVVQETEYDEKVDIWAIGMMTYECILGKIPFRIYSELDLNRIVEDEVKFPEYIDVSDDAKDFILGIMQKNPDDRMVMKDIFKHPFIRKYLNQRKLAPEIMEEFRRVLN